MEKQKIILKVIIIILIILLISYKSVYATTNTNLIKQQNEINEKIDEINSEISDIKEKKNSVLEDINILNLSISDYEDEISELTEKIDTLNSEIESKQNIIIEQEEKYEVQKKLLEKRLVALYEAGETSYLDILLQSNNLSDFISRYYLISVLVESNEELLEKIEKTRNQIEEEKKSLENSKEEINIAKNELASKKEVLDADKNKKQNLIANLSEEERELQAQLEETEEDRKKIAQELAKVTTSVTQKIEPSEAGYIYPINGKTKANITTDYNGYTTIKGKHTGVDFACSAGTPIVAVKDGTVVISTAAKNPNGTYRSYGEYIAIDHYDGTVTLYAHMLANSRMVQVGDKVSQGQQIGEVGSTGNSTGNHLHFEVRTNNGKNCVDPKPYLK
jgi:murein DD-endopeptidase MepM/ murein hydrolase activator NlpD